MADNTQVSSGAGDIIRDIDRGGVKTQVMALDAGGQGAESLVSQSNPLPIAIASANFIASTNNSSDIQIQANESFVGTIESCFNQPLISIMMTCDQPVKLYIKQYIDITGTFEVSPIVFDVQANAGFNQSLTSNGNFIQIVVENRSSHPTTNFHLNVAFGNETPVTSQGNMPIAINEISGVKVTGSLPVQLASYHQDAFNQLVVAQRKNDFQCVFAGSGTLANLMNITATGSASASWLYGQTRFTTGYTNPSTIIASSKGTVDYIAGNELFAYFTAYWDHGATSTFQRIGLIDNGQNGFFVSFEDVTFNIGKIDGGVVTTLPQGLFNIDNLRGDIGSRFTRGGVPEAVNFSYQNVFRIRFGWVGSASIVYEIFSPDGEWTPFHIDHNPNTKTIPSIQNPNLPISVWMSDLGNNLTMGTSCWAAGSSSPFSKIETPLTDQSLVTTCRSVSVGETIDGNYINIITGKHGEQMQSMLHARYYENTYRGNQFIVSNQAPVAITAGLSTTYTGLAVANPAGSGVNLVLSKVTFTPSSVLSNATAIGIMTGSGALTSTLSVRNRKLGASAGHAIASDGQTLPSTPVLEQTFAQFNTSQPSGISAYDLEGQIIIPPGYYAAMYSLSAESASFLFSMAWEEVPI